MENDRPPILRYASPDSSNPTRPSATLLFAGGAAVTYFTLTLIQLILGQLDILLGPACGCIVVPAVAAAIFHAAAAVRASFNGQKLLQRNSLIVFGLGIVSLAVPLAIGFLADSFSPPKWSGTIFLCAAAISPVVGAWFAFGSTGDPHSN